MTTWTETKIAAMVSKIFPSPAYAFLTHVRNGTGFSRRKDSTADALAVSCYPSRGLYLSGIEIKVSKSDWRREVAHPEKAEEIQQYCRYWYVAAPKDLIPHVEVPATWGLIECEKSAVIKIGAPKLEEKPVDILLLAAILRRFGQEMVPKISIAEEISNRVESAINQEKNSWETKIQSLEETIRNFEDASGIQLDKPWRAGNIGSAVKIVLNEGSEKILHSIRYLRDEHMAIVDRFDRFLESSK